MQLHLFHILQLEEMLLPPDAVISRPVHTDCCHRVRLPCSGVFDQTGLVLPSAQPVTRTGCQPYIGFVRNTCSRSTEQLCSRATSPLTTVDVIHSNSVLRRYGPQLRGSRDSHQLHCLYLLLL